MMRGILVYLETNGGLLTRTSRELISSARAIADIMQEPIIQEPILAALLAGDEPRPQDLCQFGIDTLYDARHPALNEYSPDAYLAAITAIAQNATPNIIVLPGTIIGKDIAPRLAQRLHAGIITDVVDIKKSEDGVIPLFIRMAYGGKTEAVIKPTAFPLVVTIKPRAFDPIHEQETATAMKVMPIVIDFNSPTPQPLRLKERMPEPDTGVKLEDATIVISGGRGINGAEGFDTLRELAGILHGAVGASRVATDAGWTPDTMQVGQTGKTVSPNLYIAIGISGATQHLAGMTGSKTIVAINTDIEAPIFKAAHIGIVRDWRQFLPAFIIACKTYMKEKG